MKNFKLLTSTFIKGILAGICIGIGGMFYLKALDYTNNVPLASFMFPIGLILICSFGFFLYTGKICYVFENKLSFLFHLLIGLIGNYVGTLIISFLIKAGNFVPECSVSIINAKASLEIVPALVKAFFCGMLVFFAVEGFNKIEGMFGKYLILILSIACFIVCGFEHSIADMFYVSLDKTMDVICFRNIMLIILGNSIGGMFIPFLKIVIKRLERGKNA